MFTRESKSARGCNFNTALFKPKDFSMSQADTYSVKVAGQLSRTRCEIETLLHTDHWKWYVRDQIAAPMTLGDIDGHLPIARLFERDLSYIRTATGKIWLRASSWPSVIAEFVVKFLWPILSLGRVKLRISSRHTDWYHGTMNYPMHEGVLWATWHFSFS